MQSDMRLKLSDREWNIFKLATIFKIENCKCSKVSGLRKGTIPYVGATNRNNGVMSFVKSDEKLITKGNCIAFICDGEGSVGYSIYKSEDFVGSTTVKIGRNAKLNKYNATFITTIADTVRSKYNFGFKRNATHLKNEILMLPTNKNAKPDFEFMEAFMKQKEQEKLEQYNKYISQKIKELNDFKTVEPIEEKGFSEFEIGKLFALSQGKSKGLNHLTKRERGVNYLGATNLNNGVLCQVEKVNKLVHAGNGIAFIRNGEGSMGYSVYKAEKFIATSDISVGYNPNLNRYIGLFITTVADKVRGKYNFGYKRSSSRLVKEKILLPINDKGDPDYEYMENYIKSLEFKKILSYLDYKNMK